MITRSRGQTFQLWQRWPICTSMYARCILYTREEILSHIFPIFNVFLLIQLKPASLHQLAGGLGTPYTGLCNLHRYVLNLGFVFFLCYGFVVLFLIVYFVCFPPFVPTLISVFVCFLPLVIGCVLLVQPLPSPFQFTATKLWGKKGKPASLVSSYWLLLIFNLKVTALNFCLNSS